MRVFSGPNYNFTMLEREEALNCFKAPFYPLTLPSLPAPLQSIVTTAGPREIAGLYEIR